MGLAVVHPFAARCAQLCVAGRRLDREVALQHGDGVVLVRGVGRIQNLLVGSDRLHLSICTEVADCTEVVLTDQAFHRTGECGVVLTKGLLRRFDRDGGRLRGDLKVTVLNDKGDIGKNAALVRKVTLIETHVVGFCIGFSYRGSTIELKIALRVAGIGCAITGNAFNRISGHRMRIAIILHAICIALDCNNNWISNQNFNCGNREVYLRILTDFQRGHTIERSITVLIDCYLFRINCNLIGLSVGVNGLVSIFHSHSSLKLPFRREATIRTHTDGQGICHHARFQAGGDAGANCRKHLIQFICAIGVVGRFIRGCNLGLEVIANRDFLWVIRSPKIAFRSVVVCNLVFACAKADCVECGLFLQYIRTVLGALEGIIIASVSFAFNTIPRSTDIDGFFVCFCRQIVRWLTISQSDHIRIANLRNRSGIELNTGKAQTGIQIGTAGYFQLIDHMNRCIVVCWVGHVHPVLLNPASRCEPDNGNIAAQIQILSIHCTSIIVKILETAVRFHKADCGDFRSFQPFAFH